MYVVSDLTKPYKLTIQESYSHKATPKNITSYLILVSVTSLTYLKGKNLSKGVGNLRQQ